MRFRIVGIADPQPISIIAIFAPYFSFWDRNEEYDFCCWEARVSSQLQSLNIRMFGRWISWHFQHFGKLMQLISLRSTFGWKLFGRRVPHPHCRKWMLPCTSKIRFSLYPALLKCPSTFDVTANRLSPFSLILLANSLIIWKPSCGCFSRYICSLDPQKPQKRLGFESKKSGLAHSTKLNLLRYGGQAFQKPSFPRKSGSPESLPKPAPAPTMIVSHSLRNLAALAAISRYILMAYKIDPSSNHLKLIPHRIMTFISPRMQSPNQGSCKQMANQDYPLVD